MVWHYRPSSSSSSTHPTIPNLYLRTISLPLSHLIQQYSRYRPWNDEAWRQFDTLYLLLSLHVFYFNKVSVLVKGMIMTKIMMVGSVTTAISLTCRSVTTAISLACLSLSCSPCPCPSSPLTSSIFIPPASHPVHVLRVQQL